MIIKQIRDPKLRREQIQKNAERASENLSQDTQRRIPFQSAIAKQIERNEMIRQ